jgi:aryl-alcohol dehydrogenase-like predicted oxidoreductase
LRRCRSTPPTNARPRFDAPQIKTPRAADSRRTTFDFPPVSRDRAYDCIDAMRPIARRMGVSVAQIALAWLLHQQQVTSVIVGAKRCTAAAQVVVAKTSRGSEVPVRTPWE